MECLLFCILISISIVKHHFQQFASPFYWWEKLVYCRKSMTKVDGIWLYQITYLANSMYVYRSCPAWCLFCVYVKHYYVWFNYICVSYHRLAVFVVELVIKLIIWLAIITWFIDSFLITLAYGCIKSHT
jgi:hypothetical protein